MSEPLNGWALPAPEDELPHVMPAGGPDLPYKDTWYFGWRDDEAGVTGGVHLTVSPNRAPGSRSTVAVDWGRRRMLKTVYAEPALDGDGVSTPLLGLRVHEGAWTPAKHLTITVAHEDLVLEIDVRGRHFGPLLTALHPGLVPTSEGLVGLSHAEQAGTFDGRIRWDGAEAAINGQVYRDRSWGFRKSDKAALHGYTFGQVHLMDASLGVLAWQSSDATSDAALPVGVWLADDTGVMAATGGSYVRSAEGRPDHCHFEFGNGRVVDLVAEAALAELLIPYHEPEWDGPAVGTFSLDEHVRFRSPTGPVFGMFNHGSPFMADVLRHSKFCVPA